MFWFILSIDFKEKQDTLVIFSRISLTKKLSELLLGGSSRRLKTAQLKAMKTKKIHMGHQDGDTGCFKKKSMGHGDTGHF